MNLNKNILCLIAAILTILFLTVMDSRGQFGFNNVAVVGSFTATATSNGGGGCSTTFATNNLAVGAPTGDELVGSSAANYFGGQIAYDPGSTISPCKMSATLSAVGIISGKSYTMQKWTYSDPNMATLVATSEPVTGNDSWSLTTVDFTFATGTMTNGSPYCIVLSCGSSDGSNYVRWHHSSSGGLTGFSGQFDSGGVRTSYDGGDVKIAIFTP